MVGACQHTHALTSFSQCKGLEKAKLIPSHHMCGVYPKLPSDPRPCFAQKFLITDLIALMTTRLFRLKNPFHIQC